MKQTVLFLLLAIVGTFTASAQELSVKSFEVKTNDLSARTQNRQDNNGNDCALVKVLLASPGAVFSGNVVGDVKYDTSEYWVYMPQGSKRLTVKLEGYLPLEVSFEDKGVKGLEGKTTYVMSITGIVMNGQAQETPRVKTGWIILNSTPQGAAVYINGDFVGNTPLNNYKQAYGTYSYRLEHPNYHEATGKIELNDSRFERTITLTPAFGSIRVTSNTTGATVLLDGKSTGKTTPCTLEEVPSGQHTITVQLDKYAPRQLAVNVEDGKTAQLSAELSARFANVTISSLEGAQIYCNGKLLGTSRYVGDMMEGFYDVEVRMNHYKSASQQLQVTAGKSQDITLNPTPIYGSLDVVSTPHDAEITIDGKTYGKTPNTIDKLLEGEHSISLALPGYVTITERFTIKENENSTVSLNLQKEVENAGSPQEKRESIESENTQTRNDLIIELLNHPIRSAQTNSFVSGENIYIRFKSPNKGYVAVYLMGTDQKTKCLLPDKQTTRAFPVEAGKEYILLDSKTDRLSSYQITTNTRKETNKLVLIFSPHLFYKATEDGRSVDGQVNTLNSLVFNEWLWGCQEQDREMIVKEKLIDIHGTDVASWDSESIALLRRAENGDATAQNNLGYRYSNGIGVPKNNVEAIRWYRRAAEQGDATAQYNLGVHFQNGAGVRRDNSEAEKWYKKAAEQGYESAQKALQKMNRY